MDKQRLIDRMLETENLTDELEDADASWLLDWGVTRLDQVLQGIENDEAANSRVNALMAVMRSINRIVGSYADKSPQEVADDLAGLSEAFRAAFPASVLPPGQPDRLAAVARLSRLSPPLALRFLAQEYIPLTI